MKFHIKTKFRANMAASLNLFRKLTAIPNLFRKLTAIPNLFRKLTAIPEKRPQQGRGK